MDKNKILVSTNQFWFIFAGTSMHLQSLYKLDNLLYINFLTQYLTYSMSLPQDICDFTKQWI